VGKGALAGVYLFKGGTIRGVFVHKYILKTLTHHDNVSFPHDSIIILVKIHIKRFYKTEWCGLSQSVSGVEAGTRSRENGGLYKWCSYTTVTVLRGLKLYH